MLNGRNRTRGSDLSKQQPVGREWLLSTMRAASLGSRYLVPYAPSVFANWSVGCYVNRSEIASKSSHG